MFTLQFFDVYISHSWCIFVLIWRHWQRGIFNRHYADLHIFILRFTSSAPIR